MMRLKHQNLLEIWQRFDVNTCAAQALQEMESMRKGEGFDLEELLRDHRTDGIDDEDEAAMRDAFDDLLAYYSCVEIAAIIDFVPSPLPADFRTSTIAVLTNPFVRKYYRKYYPLLLPDMLLSRIAGIKALRERSTSTAIPLFFEFLHICSVIDDDSSIEMLLWLLDEGYHRGYDWQSTVAIITKPDRLAKALVKSARRRNAAETAAEGLRKFLIFCVAFDDLLARSKGLPLFQAAIGHYQSYWFRVIRGEVRSKLDAALQGFERWLRLPATRRLPKDQIEAMRVETESALKQVRNVVGRLTGNGYGRALNTRRTEIRRDSVSAKDFLTKRKKKHNAHV